MTVGITIISPAMVAHRTGCADVAKAIKGRGAYHGSANEQSANDYSAETAVEAILTADSDLASWFGETAYQDNMSHWTVATCELAPCTKPIMKGIEFDDRGRPTFTGKVAPEVAVKVERMCECGCGGSPKGKRSQFLPGHDAKLASSIKSGMKVAARISCGKLNGKWKCQLPAGHTGRHGTKVK